MDERSERLSDSSGDDLAPPPKQNPALIAGALAAIAGSVVWGMVAFYGHVEIGWLAVGIGALIGFAMVKVGGHGMQLTVIAAVLAVLSIGSGKYLSYSLLSEFMYPEEWYQELPTDAADWQKVDQSSDGAVRRFMQSHGYDFETTDAFRAEVGRMLEHYTENKPSIDEWRAHALEHYTFVEHLKQDFSPIDILFVVLGIAAAAGQLSKRTKELEQQTARRVRAERRAAEEAAAAEDSDETPPTDG